jgi:hypothetical protein
MGFQILHARLVNKHLDALGLSGAKRGRLRNDRGVVPWRVGAVGILARIFLVAGVPLPILNAIGLVKPGVVRVR